MSVVRVNGIVAQSIVDGPGLRLTVFTQGCPHACIGCHNPQTHNPTAGFDVDTDHVLSAFKRNPLLAGVTFSGGEPILQAESLIPLAQAVVDMGKNCIIYSGFTFEELVGMHDKAVDELLSLCKLLIDGRFVLEQRDLTLTFRGSHNQRIINIPASLEQGRAVLAEID